MSPLPRSVAGVGRRAVDALPDGTRRRVRAALGRPLARQVTLDRLDAELAVVADLFERSEDEARRFLDGFELAVPPGAPADPFSDAYRQWTWDVYERISGRTGYSVANEHSPFDYERAVVRPFPYQTGSATVVGDDLVARGHLVRCLGDPALELAPPARVVEFGPGWGNLTVDLAATGFAVTAVEVDAGFADLVRSRCPVGADLSVEVADMLEFEPSEPFDAAVFFESFHHCADHLAMLRRLHRIVRPGGVVLFASEPVQQMPYPWGPRLDGQSLWSTRTHGWLELGFDTAYFDKALARTGWEGTRRPAGPGYGAADVIVVRARDERAGR